MAVAASPDDAVELAMKLLDKMGTDFYDKYEQYLNAPKQDSDKHDNEDDWYISGLEVLYSKDSTPPEQSIYELRSDSTNVNKGFGGLYVWLVPTYTSRRDEACTSFETVQKTNPDAGWKDLAKGAGGLYRYLKCNKNFYENDKIRRVALIRKPNTWVTMDDMQGYLFHGYSSDINFRREGEYLNLVWSTSKVGLLEKGRCGRQGMNTICENSLCCSKAGECGSTELHCGFRCQSNYGNCTATNLEDVSLLRGVSSWAGHEDLKKDRFTGCRRMCRESTKWPPERQLLCIKRCNEEEKIALKEDKDLDVYVAGWASRNQMDMCEGHCQQRHLWRKERERDCQKKCSMERARKQQEEERLMKEASCPREEPATPLDRHLVVLKDGLINLNSHLEELHNVHSKRSLGSEKVPVNITHHYSGTEYGFMAYAGFFESHVLEYIRNHNEVAIVEKDEIVLLAGVLDGVADASDASVKEYNETDKTPSKRDMSSKSRVETTQFSAPWNLHAISHRQPLPFVRSGCCWTYHHNALGGEKTYAYVIDTGVRVTHNQFEGRAEHGCTVKPGLNECSKNPADHVDSIGHGTHVAGIIASRTYGVAKKARVIAVKVFDQEGLSERSLTLQGYNWAVTHILRKRRAGAAVINISWCSMESSAAMCEAIRKAFKKGIITVVCAGNRRASASICSPSNAEHAITVGSFGRDWAFDLGANYGPAIDIMAPGLNIASLSSSDDDAVRVWSGTSMAAPHVAGLVLTAMSVHGKKGHEVRSFLVDTATKDSISGPLRGSPNLAANNNNLRQSSANEPQCCQESS
ncbi:hypothetical protein CDD81_3985 [Ophiocordyceps australis]|uniref:Chitin-binding type-1 domain-containing protein n=1 Tax=Ophiocordyceps australis TaxID=1399860 RepID=A0A2C5YAS6_9HYPO|nr:hypothetical protein CDD81_3985 [Ophiocordyceps australis]